MRCRAVCVLAILTMAVAPWAHGVTYTFVDLNPTGYTTTSANAIGGGGQVGAGGSGALLWSGSAGSVVSLHPGGNFNYTRGEGGGAGQQVGWGYNSATGHDHALLWTGSAASVEDLHPAAYDGSRAFGAAGGQQVGTGYDAATYNETALLWTGTAASAVSLHPATGYQNSWAYATDGSQQVGSAETDGGDEYALLWTGTAASGVVLHPAGYDGSIAEGVGDGQQVGTGWTSTAYEALLWTGSAGSAVSLNPGADYHHSSAMACAGGVQVGYAECYADSESHALAWFGTDASVVDLNTFLPAGYEWASASGIDADGNIVGQAGGPGFAHACMWIPQAAVIPEPATMALLGLGLAAVARRRRRK